MIATEVFQRLARRLKLSIAVCASVRRSLLRLRGAKIGGGTRIPRISVTWPHQISLGENCVLEDDIYFKFDGPWRRGPAILIGNRVFIGRGCEFNIRRRIVVGDDCLIASDCKFIDHDHGISMDRPMNVQSGQESEIELEQDVWLGVNCVVLKGVTIGRGAVVGASSVVTKPIPPFEIWAGVPAIRIGQRVATVLQNRSQVLGEGTEHDC